MKYCSTLWLLVACLSAGCEPYNLKRATFPACTKPSATISYTADALEVVLFLENKQGDIGVVGWNLGDGRYKTGERIKIAYSRPGTYTATAILANPCDDSFVTSRTISVPN